uniref:Poly(A)-specific ribonuclease n=1 Tax=Opuntia streptacantha TaxID=393608 RepID=A0A7C9A1P7_OPUST
MKIVFPSRTVSFPLSSPPTKLRVRPRMRQLLDYTRMHNDDRRERPAPARQVAAAREEHHSMASNHSRHTAKRRKVIYEEETETLTLKRCSVEWKSSSKHFVSTRTRSSYQNHKRYSRKDSSSRHVHRKWSSSDTDCSGFRGVENASRHPDLYCNIPWKYMDWDYRKACIHRELIKYDPSILCFQEVDRFRDLHDILKPNGFKGVLKARTGDACDGCAMFWKDQRFTLLREENIEFQSFGLRNNVAQFCVLKMKENQSNSDPNLSKSQVAASRCLVVGNIHVLFNPNRGDVKLGQIRLFLEKAHELSEEWGGIPVVLAGDFNSLPQSSLYQFISSAELDLLQHDRKNISGQIDMPLHRANFRCLTEEFFRQRSVGRRWNDDELKLATGNERVTHLRHHLKLRSAYLGIPGNGTTRDKIGEPLATSCHSKFTGTVDYIWHSEELLPVRVLEPLPVPVLRNMGGLPNKKCGSDHLALVCEFAFAGE